MNPRPNDIEKSIRTLVRKEIESSPALKEERKRLRKGQPRSSAPWLYSAFLETLVLCLVLWSVFSKLPTIDSFLGGLTLWATVLVFHRAEALRMQLYLSSDLLAYSHLPISDGELFQVQWRRALSESLAVLFDLSIPLAVAGFKFGFSPSVWFAAGMLCLVHWTIILTLAVVLVLHRPYWPLAWYKALIWPIVLMLMFSGDHFGGWFAQSLEGFQRWAGLVLPAGWVNSVLQRGALEGSLTAAILALPIGLVLSALRPSWRQLSQQYAFSTWMCDAQSQDESGEASERNIKGDDGSSRRFGVTDIEEGIRGGELLSAFIWAKFDLLERLAAPWLTSREKDVAEFMLGARPGWTARWKTAAAFAMAGLVAGSALPNQREQILLISGLLAAMIGLPIFGGIWQGYEKKALSSVFLPLYAVYPVGYREFARVFLKINALRSLAFLPVAAAFGLGSFWELGQHPLAGAMLAFKATGLVLLWQPVLLALRFSAGTNDTQKSIMLASMLVFCLLCLLALSAGFLFAPNAKASWTCGLAAAVLASGLNLVYRRRYERGNFDLLSRTNEDFALSAD